MKNEIEKLEIVRYMASEIQPMMYDTKELKIQELAEKINEIVETLNSLNKKQ